MGVKKVADDLLKKIKIAVLNDPDTTEEGTSDAQKQNYQAALDASEEEAQNLAVRSGKSTCLPLCQTMQQKLPRELRDMVYEHLLYTPRMPGMNRVWQGRTPRECNGCSYHENFSSNCRKHGLLHLRSVEYLGTQTVEELAEMWYRSSEFELSYDYTLDTLLREDPWHIVYSPVALINKVYVRLTKLDILEQNNISKKWKVPTEPSLKLRNIFLPLFNVKPGASIAVRIVVFEKDWHKAIQDPKDLIDTLAPAFAMCQKLVDSGFRVTMLQRWGKDDEMGVITPKDWVVGNCHRRR